MEIDWRSRIADSLTVTDEINGRLEAFESGPEADSAAAADLSREGGYYAWSFAVAGIQVAKDHLDALRHLHAAAPPHPLAPWTLIRASVEGSAMSRWIAGGPSAERAGRGVGAQQADFQERQGYESHLAAMKWAPQPSTSAVTRITELSAEAADGGIKKIRLPRPTQLVASQIPAAPLGERTFPSAALYTMLSAMAHSKMWVMPILGDVLQRDAMPASREMDRTVFVAPLDIVWMVVEWARVGLLLAMDDLETYGRR